MCLQEQPRQRLYLGVPETQHPRFPVCGEWQQGHAEQACSRWEVQQVHESYRRCETQGHSHHHESKMRLNEFRSLECIQGKLHQRLLEHVVKRREETS